VYESEKVHNIAKTANHSVVWGKTRVDLNDCFAGSGTTWLELSAGQPTLSIVIGEVGGRCEPRVRLDTELAKSRASSGGHASLIPEDMQIWGYSSRIRRVREVRVWFTEEEFEAVFEADSKDLLRTPRLMFHDERIQQFGQLLADECVSRAPAGGLYAEGLLVALMATFVRSTDKKSNENSVVGLARPQLMAAVEFMQAHLGKNITLSEIAAVAGLSSSQFARAFRRSTGISPHQWHLERRLRRAQDLLANSNRSLVEIALETGFSEQSHFTRVFRSIAGITPGQWRRSYGRSKSLD
jgi:AraC family transcriptional regulator